MKTAYQEQSPFNHTRVRVLACCCLKCPFHMSRIRGFYPSCRARTAQVRARRFSDELSEPVLHHQMVFTIRASGNSAHMASFSRPRQAKGDRAGHPREPHPQNCVELTPSGRRTGRTIS